ncbi:putative mediator of RNA polymerase II transcription subunit 14 [Triangularia verruculosa]|uniref:Mediator of RNA polymerase II transcription subunit 14 n=1 Tax=Triangularia verruculosa TaxID=2587418 RepID=A0AAN6XE67_9PEZI|nr:putative mediator of RNA polymerase II transcription subunit 14 [Triangularia verruculosa]
MAGAFRMENGTQNGVRSNHDRDGWTNGVNGESIKQEHKGKGVVGGSGRDVVKLEELPDELQHITAEIIPLNMLLSRLAQYSHGALQDQIMRLDSMPLPQNLSNGTTSYHPTATEDTSPESLEKKRMLLNFIQDLHTRWVKALVLTDWSRNAEQVGKLIDIRTHLASKLELFSMAIWEMIKMKQDMLWAKIPSPDLKTALEVISHSKIHWMPDFDYLPPPEVTPEEKDAWIEEVNTLLSARLSLEEFERIPAPFLDYKIDSGVATFSVPGEFEVDVTIGDDDFEKQFWFIDLRFRFFPAPPELSEHARLVAEMKVNNALGTDGLLGAYNYLHDLTLTAKIGEFTRQAWQLRAGRWADSLKVERLNRALAVHYWANRPHSKGSKSWIIVGVNSSKGEDGRPDPSHPSYISLRWFRDSVEVKDFDIKFDVDDICMETLLETVISRHIEHMLSSIYNKLAGKPRFAQKQGRLILSGSREKAGDFSLRMQVLDTTEVTVSMDVYTGAFTLYPQSPMASDVQRRLNTFTAPAEEGAAVLEMLRCHYTTSALMSRAKSIRWMVSRQSPLSMDELKSIVYSGPPSAREPFQTFWLKKVGWNPQWFVFMSMSLGGDQWWLVEMSTQQRQGATGTRVKMFTKMPMATEQLRLSDKFFENLTLYATGMIAQITDLRELHSKRMAHTTREAVNYNLPAQIKMPTVYVRLSDMLASRGSKDGSGASWAQEYIPIVFKGVQAENPMKIIAEAKLTVTNRRKFQFLKGNVDHDVQYNPQLGQFSLRLRGEMGVTVITSLTARIQALDRLIELVDAIARAGKAVVHQSVTLREVVFTYSDSIAAEEGAAEPASNSRRSWRVRLDLTKERGVNVDLESGNPHYPVIDYIREMANSHNFENLPSWLVLSLPLYRALEKLEEKRSSLQDQPVVAVLHRALNWVTIRYQFGVPPRRLINIEIRPRSRQGKLMWHVHRVVDVENTKTADIKPENDEVNNVLVERVWTANGTGFKGLTSGAAASLEQGIEELVALVDETIRSIATGGAVAQQPQTQPQPQQQQQLPHHQPQPQPQPPQQGPTPQQFQQAQQAARFQQQMQQRQQQQQQQMPAANMHAGPPHPTMMNRRPSQQGQQRQHQQQQNNQNYGSSMANALVLD